MEEARTPALLAALVFLLFACSAGPVGVISHPPGGGAKILPRVPFFAQEEYQCGPAAMATVLNYWYIKGNRAGRLDPEAIAAEIYSPSARGVLGLDLALYARKLGFEAHESSGSAALIRQSIDRGIPLIILVDYGVSLFQRNHFMVAVGYTDEAIIFNSGRRENEQIFDGELERLWKKTRFWSLAVTPSNT